MLRLVSHKQMHDSSNRFSKSAIVSTNGIKKICKIPVPQSFGKIESAILTSATLHSAHHYRTAADRGKTTRERGARLYSRVTFARGVCFTLVAKVFGHNARILRCHDAMFLVLSLQRVAAGPNLGIKDLSTPSITVALYLGGSNAFASVGNVCAHVVNCRSVVNVARWR